MKKNTLLLCVFLVLWIAAIGDQSPQRTAHAATAAHHETCASFYMTYYYPTGSLTRTGNPAVWGEVAVDPSIVPLYSYIRIIGISGPRKIIFRAYDTGGAVNRYHLDVLVNDQPTGQWIVGRTGYRRACYW